MNRPANDTLPRLLPAHMAAWYCGCVDIGGKVNMAQFRREVRQGDWPPAIQLKRRTHVWDIRELDKAIDKKLGLISAEDKLMERINAL